MIAAPVQTAFFTSPDRAEIAYRFRAGPRPFVLLHGLGHDASLWDGVVAGLPEEVGLIVPESRGHGASTLGWRPPSVDQWAADVFGILAARGIEAPAIVGLSMGGYTALAIAAAHPGFARAFALVSTSAAADDEAGRARRAAAIAMIRREGWKAFLRGQLPAYLDASRQDYPVNAARVTAMFERAGDSGLPPAIMALASRPDRRSILKSIAVPSVAIVGAADPLTPPDAARVVATGIPGARLHVLDRVAHLSALEAPREIAELIGAL